MATGCRRAAGKAQGRAMQGETRAALWIVAGTATVAVADNLVPLLARQMGLWQLLVLRSLISLPIAVGFGLAMVKPRALLGQRPGAVAVRTWLIVTALMFYFAALPVVPIALAAAGLFTSPIWILLISALVLRERIGWRRIAAVALGFAGVLLVLGVGRVPVHPMAMVPLGAGLFYALTVIWTRERCAAESSICLGAWQQMGFLAAGLAGVILLPWLDGLFGHVEGADFLVRPLEPVGSTPWGMLTLAAASGLLGAVLLATGYRSGRASVVGLFDYSFLVWAPVFAWILRGETLSFRVACGMALIAAAGALAMLAGREVARRDGTPA